MVQPKLDNVIDLLMLAVACDEGKDGPSDFLAAATLYRQAELLGSRFAKEQIHELVAKGVISEIDLEQAIQNFDPRKFQSFRRKPKPHLKLHDSKKRPKVLVIEDQSDTQAILDYILRKSGFDPILANDGLDALEKTLTLDDIACMLIDLQMPNMNGFEFIQTLRQNQAFEDTPILIVTSYTDPKLMERGKALGANGWMKKPVRKDLLIGNIRRVLKEKERVA